MFGKNSVFPIAINLARGNTLNSMCIIRNWSLQQKRRGLKQVECVQSQHGWISSLIKGVKLSM
jgi:hypothetical protein